MTTRRPDALSYSTAYTGLGREDNKPKRANEVTQIGKFSKTEKVEGMGKNGKGD